MDDFHAGLKLRIVTPTWPPHNTAAPQTTEGMTRLCLNQSQASMAINIRVMPRKY